jgi:uncharacterized protein (DUF433 family)
MPWYEKFVTRIPGVQGGEPIIVGTRTPVRTIATLYHVTYPGDLDRVLAALPHLNQAQIEAGLAYYRDHRDEIDADIERQRAALSDFRTAS